MAEDHFVVPGRVRKVAVSVKYDKEGGAIKTMVFTVESDTSLMSEGQIAATAADLAGVSGEKVLVSIATEQTRLGGTIVRPAEARA